MAALEVDGRGRVNLIGPICVSLLDVGPLPDTKVSIDFEPLLGIDLSDSPGGPIVDKGSDFPTVAIPGARAFVSGPFSRPSVEIGGTKGVTLIVAAGTCLDRTGEFGAESELELA